MLFYQMILEVEGVTEVIVADVTIVIFPFSCMWDEQVVFKGHMSVKCYWGITFMSAYFTVQMGGRRGEMVFPNPGWRTPFFFCSSFFQRCVQLQ